MRLSTISTAGSTRSRGVEYRATTAQWHAQRRAGRPKVSKLVANDELRRYVGDRLGGQIAHPDGEVVPGPEVVDGSPSRSAGLIVGGQHFWSPGQISNRLRMDFAPQ